MAQGQSISVTRALAQEYNRLARAYQEISQSFDRDSIAEVKFTAILAIENVQLLLNHPRVSRLNQVDSAYSSH